MYAQSCTPLYSGFANINFLGFPTKKRLLALFLSKKRPIYITLSVRPNVCYISKFAELISYPLGPHGHWCYLAFLSRSPLTSATWHSCLGPPWTGCYLSSCLDPPGPGCYLTFLSKAPGPGCYLAFLSKAPGPGCYLAFLYKAPGPGYYLTLLSRSPWTWLLPGIPFWQVRPTTGSGPLPLALPFRI